jgi:GNAT superfamily N-acetyltransferase
MTVAFRLEKYLTDWHTFPGDAMVAYRNEGVRGVWDAIAPRTVHRVFRAGHMIVYAQPLARAPEVQPPAGVVITAVTESDWTAMATFITGRELVRFRALASNGRHCLVAWRGAQPIGYAWVAESLGPDVTLTPFPLPPDAAYLWDLYVVPAERRNGIGSALASARIRKARDLGFREGWRMIAPSNRPSLRTLHRTGEEIRIVGELRFIKVLRRMHVRFTPQAGPPQRSR